MVTVNAAFLATLVGAVLLLVPNVGKWRLGLYAHLASRLESFGQSVFSHGTLKMPNGWAQSADIKVDREEAQDVLSIVEQIWLVHIAYLLTHPKAWGAGLVLSGALLIFVACCDGQSGAACLVVLLTIANGCVAGAWFVLFGFLVQLFGHPLLSWESTGT